MATFYIHPGSSTNGVGSEADPYNAWPSLSSNNTYLQKAGTTATANLTAFGSSNITIGVYGTGEAPIVSGGSGIALNCSNATNIALSGVSFVSTGNYAVSWNGGSTFTLTNASCVGARCGLNIIASAAAVSNVTLTSVTARNTSAVNENSGVFIGAQSSNAVTNVTASDCVFCDSVGYGMQVKASSDDSASVVSGLFIKNSLFNRNGRSGLLITTGMTALNTSKVCQGVRLLRNEFVSNTDYGASICARGGLNVVAHNIVTDNNANGSTGTGGLQLAGASGVSIYGNTCSRNHTPFDYDGVGLYLDVCTGTLNDVGTEYCMVWGNLCEDNADFSTESLESANLSAGIATYHCANNTICGNVLVNNAAGVCIGAWSSGNQVYNNTIIGGDYGIVTLWNVAGHNNVAKNNIIVNAEIAALGNSDAGTRPSAGDITLSATTGLITVTSSGTAFTTHSTGYAIVAGSGWGFVVSKTNNSVVIVQVVSAFSSTSFTNGNWQISFGGDQGEWANYSCLYGNAENVSAGSGQSLTVGTNNVTDDPLLDASYRPSSSSPCVDAGTQVAGVVLRDFYGKEINGTPDIGAVQRYAARSASTARTESTARTASTTRSYPMRRGIP